jgi:hypothetical protein
MPNIARWSERYGRRPGDPASYVRKVLRSGETSFGYEREVQPRPKLDRWTADLDELLAGNAAKAAHQQLTLIRIFEDLRGRGCQGGYDAVRRYAKRWSEQRVFRREVRCRRQARAAFDQARLNTLRRDRPDTYRVTYDVVDPKSGKIVYSNSKRFQNEAGQEFERISAADIRNWKE